MATSVIAHDKERNLRLCRDCKLGETWIDSGEGTETVAFLGTSTVRAHGGRDLGVGAGRKNGAEMVERFGPYLAVRLIEQRRDDDFALGYWESMPRDAMAELWGR